MSQGAAGLYLHVPFCARVCPYCDFAVRTGNAEKRRQFVEHLLAEIELYAGFPLTFDTVYFGGGTPSSLSTGDLGRILDRVRGRLTLAAGTLVFLEANPEDITAESAAELRRIGVDTLSLGVQSLDPAGLAFLGRRHGVEDVRRAVQSARDAGFRTLSVDLIYGLPGQTVSDWRRQLDQALALGPDHVSCYQLTIHQRTRFALLEQRGRLVQLTGDEQGELFRLTHRHLNAAGLQGYEVSQFAADPAHRSRHNVKYWDHTPYLGLGPAAHSFHDGRRWWNLRRSDPWAEQVSQGARPVEATETLSTADLVLEVLMTGLRTYAGVDLAAIRKRLGVDLVDQNGALLRRLTDEGLAERREDRVLPTLDGLAVADSLAAAFRIEPLRRQTKRTTDSIGT